jgi:alkylation response protein AidB-like acyl-CoA dehydrogenase
MDFTLTSDQAALLTALERLAAPFAEPPADFRRFALVSAELEEQLEAAGFFDVAATPELGPVAAALCVERLARLPCAAEVALSMLVLPRLTGGGWPRPLAFVEDGRPSRFLGSAKTVLVSDRDKLGVAAVARDSATPVDSIYAYPMAKLATTVATTPVSAQEIRKWLRIALAAEAAGLMKAAIDSTVAHVSMRKQFGRPLGSFQALQHRLAECAVLAGGVKWLALKAASTEDDGDAALAAFHAQESTARITYDLHQMLGAMGMTLEHPLHLWTYRLKALQSELGGRGAQAQAVAQLCFL